MNPRTVSLTSINDRQLDRLIKRLALALILGAAAFAAFYVIDRSRPSTTSIPDQQLASAEQAVKDTPSDLAARGNLADLYVTRARYQEAIDQYNQIIASGQDVELADFGRAGAYVGLKQWDAAAKDYQAVVDIAQPGEMSNVDPMLESAYYELGQIAMNQNRASDAVGFLTKALAIKRSDADALYLIGTAYAATGALDKAETSIRSALAFVPVGWPEAYQALADVFTKAGKPTHAQWATAMASAATADSGASIQTLTKLVDDPVAGEDAMIGLGILYESARDSGNAAAWYQKALAKDPNSSEAQLGLGRVSAGNAASPLPALPTPGVPTSAGGASK